MARVSGKVDCGYVFVDGSSIGDVTEASLKDRRILGEEGFISVVTVVNTHTSTILSGPDIHARGFVEGEKVFDSLRPLIVTALEDALRFAPAGTSTEENPFEEAVESFLDEERPHMELGRRGEPEEVAAVVAFLCSERASFVNGSNWRVDSGSVAHI